MLNYQKKDITVHGHQRFQHEYIKLMPVNIPDFTVGERLYLMFIEQVWDLKLFMKHLWHSYLNLKSTATFPMGL